MADAVAVCVIVALTVAVAEDVAVCDIVALAVAVAEDVAVCDGRSGHEGVTPSAHARVPSVELLTNAVEGPIEYSSQRNEYAIAPAVGEDTVVCTYVACIAANGGCESATISDAERTRL